VTLREIARRLVYATTFLSLLGHGGGGSCEDVAKNVSKIPQMKGSGPSCTRYQSFRVATGACFEGPVTLLTSECGEAQMTLPDGRVLDGTDDDGVATFETEKGTCWVSADDYLIVCWGEAGSCESALENPPAPPAPDAGEENGGVDGGDDDGGDPSDSGGEGG
jgi:hypothetical protein